MQSPSVGVIIPQSATYRHSPPSSGTVSSIDLGGGGGHHVQSSSAARLQEAHSTTHHQLSSLATSPRSSTAAMMEVSESDRRAIYKHPLFPLMALLFERCEQATQTPDGGSLSASLKADIQSFIEHHQQNAGDMETAIGDQPEVDNLMIRAIQILRIHLLELEKVNELCKDFCARYIACLRAKLQNEQLLHVDAFESDCVLAPSSSTSRGGLGEGGGLVDSMYGAGAMGDTIVPRRSSMDGIDYHASTSGRHDITGYGPTMDSDMALSGGGDAYRAGRMSGGITSDRVGGVSRGGSGHADPYSEDSMKPYKGSSELRARSRETSRAARYSPLAKPNGGGVEEENRTNQRRREESRSQSSTPTSTTTDNDRSSYVSGEDHRQAKMPININQSQDGSSAAIHQSHNTLPLLHQSHDNVTSVEGGSRAAVKGELFHTSYGTTPATGSHSQLYLYSATTPNGGGREEKSGAVNILPPASRDVTVHGLPHDPPSFSSSFDSDEESDQ